MSLRLSVAVVALALVSGCGLVGSDTNGIEELSARRIVDRAEAAAKSASSVRVKGEIAIDGQPMAFDIQLKGDEGATGWFTASGRRIELVRVGETAYLRGDEGLYESLGALPDIESEGDALSGKYLMVAAEGESFSAFAAFTSVERLFEQVLHPADKLGKGRMASVNGRQALAVVVSGEGVGGTLYVSLSDEPYPLRIALPEGAKSRGTIDFLDYNAPVELNAPGKDNVIDVEGLLARSSED